MTRPSGLLRQSAPSVPEEPLIEIGQVGRPHGIKGESTLHYYADSLEWLDGPLWLRAGETGPLKPAKAAAYRQHNGQLLVRFEGIGDRSAVETLRGLTVLIPESLLPESDEEALYLHDLLGMRLLLYATGQEVGTLAHVDFVGEQELWIVESPEGKEILFPAVSEFVDSVDFDAGEIRISPPPGLLELYE